MESRFWAGGSSSEEERSDSDASGSEVETSTQQQQRAASRWAVQSDSDSDVEVRVVKSAKDKAFEHIEKACNSMSKYLNINDWSSILTEFDTMLKHVDKAKNVIATQGKPTYYIRTMVKLDDAMQQKMKNKAEQKKMNKDNSKALIRMKGKLKKHIESMQQDIDEFRLNPISSSESESEAESDEDASSNDDDSDEDSEEESSEEEASTDEAADSAASGSVSEGDGDDDSEDSDSWPSESESSSGSDSSEGDGQLKGRAKWLKVAATESKKTRKVKIPRPTQRITKRTSMEDTDGAQNVEYEEALTLSPMQFDRKIKEIVALRGKRGADFPAQLKMLRRLVNYSRVLGPARQVLATMCILGTELFDMSNKIDQVMPATLWKAARNDLANVLILLEKNPGFELGPLTSEDHADMQQLAREGLDSIREETEEELASYVDPLPVAKGTGVIKVAGELSVFVERLSEEYTKALQQTDPHTSDYITRLFDENLLIDVAQKTQAFYERKKKHELASRVALIRAEYIYYKHQSIAQALEEADEKRRIFGDPVFLHPACNGSHVANVPIDKYNPQTMHPGSILGVPTVPKSTLDPEVDLKDGCMYVFKYGDLRSKTRAMLCRIYHHALHDRFHEARDLLLMSHIQDNISDADIPTQILFNRMMAQLGLCAFRCGLIWEAHACLSEICTGSRTKELLAQGMQNFRFQERDAEQERLERRRQVPYHMHINLELLETCHLVSAMLLEVPQMVTSRTSDRPKRVVSKAFRKLLEFHERLVFEGPPENARDHVVAAAKLLAQGSWRKCSELLVQLSVWDLFPGEAQNSQVKNMLQHKIQVEALRTYLLAFSEEYASVSLVRLMETFELPEKEVHSIVSKMMINEELQGAWDQSSQAILLHTRERTALQVLSLQYSEKLSLLVDNNERLMDLRHGGGSKGDNDWTSGRSGTTGGRRSGGDNSTRPFRSGASGRSGTGGPRSFRPYGGGRGAPRGGGRGGRGGRGRRPAQE